VTRENRPMIVCFQDWCKRHQDWSTQQHANRYTPVAPTAFGAKLERLGTRIVQVIVGALVIVISLCVLYLLVYFCAVAARAGWGD